MTRIEILKARLARIDRIYLTLQTDLEKIRAGELWWITAAEMVEVKRIEKLSK